MSDPSSKAPETLNEHRAHGGVVGYYQHEATVTACAMRYAVFVPPQAERAPVPMLTWLSGLTCTEETFMIKSGAQRLAAELGLIILAPDTSPRGADVPDDPDGGWDFGLGAGFYVNATAAPWSQHYRMYDYVVDELPALVAQQFPVDESRQGIFGHSMGGHGALTIGLKNPDRYRSVSAFAPICHPSVVPWGKKAFSGYLGKDMASWADYDATRIVAAMGPDSASGRPQILIDQGMDDQFLDEQLAPDEFAKACDAAGQRLVLRKHPGYDHGYFFISTFIDDHLRHHAASLSI